MTLTYSSHIGGREIDSGRYVYTVSTRAVLDDVFASMSLKRRLEQGGDLPPGLPAGSVVGRCSLADEVTTTRHWRRRPPPRRVGGDAARHPDHARPADPRTDRANHEELVDVLVAEGSPASLARWQVAGLLELFSEETLVYCAAQSHRRTRRGPRADRPAGRRRLSCA